jgi:hypothetical protein
MHLMNDYLIERRRRTHHEEVRRTGLAAVRPVRHVGAATTRMETP